eukprot:TRINITY_DN71038_c0_g1_i1.p1 TRINITY_DN71038_c0_g1~~TRINITY_DN71038_c0_g1_i1.p1  ORF type:complete len:560 (+),score=41.95 TRINITY_DN71038_c0_g1_i1:670-2349(+)
MNNTYLIFEYEKFTLWEFPEKFNYTDDPSKPLPEDSPDNDKAKRIIETCDSLERFLIPIAEPSSIFRRVYNFLFDHTLGYSDYVIYTKFNRQMRVELELRYGGENVCITSKDGTLLDAMYLKADSEEDQDYDSPTASELGPIVIICNPNAGYYEYAIEMHDHWIEFYRTNGINILLWNYRGYGRSKGHPTPENILADGEAVLQYLKDIKGSGRIILHGESLGGSVAAHIAAKLGCDLLFTDRTFSDLDAIAEFSVGPVAAAIMKQATGWHLETTNSFLAAQCYKVLSSDPNDAVVGEVASLKNGISKQVSLENRINGRLALTENEAYVFYRNLSDLYGMVRDFHATSRRRAKKKRRQDRPKSQDITASSGARVHTSSDGELEMSLSSMESQPPIEVSASVCINSARDAKPHIEFKVPTKYEKFMRKGDFEEYNVVVHLLNKIYSELEKVDAAGSTIGKIMKERREYRLKLLKGFLMNLDIWGSHPPARIESIYQPLPTLMEARMRSYVSFVVHLHFIEQSEDAPDQPKGDNYGVPAQRFIDDQEAHWKLRDGHTLSSPD